MPDLNDLETKQEAVPAERAEKAGEPGRHDEPDLSFQVEEIDVLPKHVVLTMRC